MTPEARAPLKQFVSFSSRPREFAVLLATMRFTIGALPHVPQSLPALIDKVISDRCCMRSVIANDDRDPAIAASCLPVTVQSLEMNSASADCILTRV